MQFFAIFFSKLKRKLHIIRRNAGYFCKFSLKKLHIPSFVDYILSFLLEIGSVLVPEEPHQLAERLDQYPHLLL